MQRTDPVELYTFKNDISDKDFSITKSLNTVGYFSTLYSALCYEKPIIIKTIDKSYQLHLTNEENINRINININTFKNEIKIISTIVKAINAPNASESDYIDYGRQYIVTYFGYGESANLSNSVLLMEYAQFGNLQNWFDYKMQNINTAMSKEDYAIICFPENYKFFNHLVNGLLFLHAHDIIHGDIKSENVVITVNPMQDTKVAKWIDLGLSQIKSPDNVKVGSPMYQAPEILIEDKASTMEGDIWGMGVILWEIARMEFAADNFVKLCRANSIPESKRKDYLKETLKLKYRPLNTFGIFANVENIIQNCWSQNPSDRPDIKTLQSEVNKVKLSFN